MGIGTSRPFGGIHLIHYHLHPRKPSPPIPWRRYEPPPLASSPPFCLSRAFSLSPTISRFVTHPKKNTSTAKPPNISPPCRPSSNSELVRRNMGGHPQGCAQEE